MPRNVSVGMPRGKPGRIPRETSGKFIEEALQGKLRRDPGEILQIFAVTPPPMDIFKRKSIVCS